MQLRLVVSNQTNPYWNVSVENYLLSLPEKDVVTMYLWKNHRTVVIGQNQNPYSECNVELLCKEGGYVMRRTTGGGAVYHDDGNINFSFIASPELYDQHRQFSVLQKAVGYYGLHTELSGRNDVLCEGRKFSGNAFSKGRYQNLHHGTVLIKGNIDDLQRYLRVKPAKLQKHGVKSVQSRVVNLSELAEVSSENIVPRLIKAFEEVYQSKAQFVDFNELILLKEVKMLYEKYSSDAWLFARWRGFCSQYVAQFEWGGVELSLDIDAEHQLVRGASLATDCLDINLTRQVEDLLVGASSVERPVAPEGASKTMIEDVLNLIY
ncbi:MAG: lipoate--protein ligase [Bacteroidales bacterium]|nr:lipoate--protein ligase [Candidatus Colimorpha pelethequi]